MQVDRIRACFAENRVLYTYHARQEMRLEEFGPIREQQVFEASQVGETIEEYPDDQPYPSCLIMGQTQTDRPLHLVCAYNKEDDQAIVITVYEPDPACWIDFRKRRRP